MAALFGTSRALWLVLVLAGVTCGGYFEDEMSYIAKVFPEEIAMFSPNLPYYGGLVALAGERAYMCPFNSDLVESLERIEITDSADAEQYKPFYAPIDETLTKPVVLLWTHKMNKRIGHIKTCPNSQCLFTENRNWLNHSLTKALYFYGTLFKITDLPLPRREGHLWALFHEESPKNNPVFSYRSMIQLFNVTSTFRQESHYPLTTQYLRSMEQLNSQAYVESVELKNRYQREEGLAPIVYVQSDCGVPSDRDKIVQWMMQYIKIDSYGKCLNNKQLPNHLRDPVQGMGNAEFIELVSKYKFAIAMENGICKDYITEKFWRPLAVGTVPITLGAPNIKEFAPSNKSIIDIRDFESIEQLVDVIKGLDRNDTAYDEYREFKRSKGMTNNKLGEILQSREWEPDFDALGLNLHGTKGNFGSHFDCYLCDLISGKKEVHNDMIAGKDHYGCPLPMEFTMESDLTRQKTFSEFWYSTWMASYCDMKVMLELSKGGKQYYSQQTFKLATRRCMLDGHWKRKYLD